MTDTTETTEGTETTEAPEGGAPKELREAYKRSQAENKALKGQLMAGAFADAGLDPEKGIGKAIAKEYDGDMTADALRAYATDEYGVEFPEGSEHPQAPAITAGTERLERVHSQSAPTVPLTQDQALGKAEADKDYDTAGAIKAKQLENLFK
ncbi:MAG: hypothetical protein ABFR89_02515 [Actinomycetota bacterium]